MQTRTKSSQASNIIAMAAQAKPALISDQLLEEMATPAYQSGIGEFDEATRAMLAVALPEMAHELLRHRRAALSFAIHPDAAAQSLETAKTTLRSSDPIPARKLAAACSTIIAHSQNTAELSAAKVILEQLQAAA